MHTTFMTPPLKKVEGVGAYCLCFVCPSVRHTFTLCTKISQKVFELGRLLFGRHRGSGVAQLHVFLNKIGFY